MEAGDLYSAADDELQAMQRHAAELVHRFNAAPAQESEQRDQVLRALLGRVGDGVEIRPPFFCDYGRYISIGAGSFANVGLVALDVAPIIIGEDVQIGPNVQLLTPTHPIDPVERRSKREAAAPIRIGDNVWIGGGAIVLAGVSIGEHSVIGAGAVVTTDVPSNVVALGNPARVRRSL